jgi:hypothetical protein
MGLGCESVVVLARIRLGQANNPVQGELKQEDVVTEALGLDHVCGSNRKEDWLVVPSCLLQ